MKKTSRIYVAGHLGMVGSALVRRLQAEGYKNSITKNRTELDLTNQAAVTEFFMREKPEYVFLAAAKVGGIYANSTYPAEFVYINQMIQCNIIHNAYKNNVKKLLFLGSSCIYPKKAKQPMAETALLSGYLESTNEAYATAKIAGIKMCQAYRKQYGCNFIAVMPTNLYGPNDSYDLETAHAMPALIRKFHEAKIARKPNVVVWGTGRPRREFLYVDDLAEACVFLMQKYSDPEIVNIGTGEDISIKALAQMIKKITQYEGAIIYDKTKPDGTVQKLLAVTKLNGLGWHAKTSLKEGIILAYNAYKSTI